MKLLVDVAVRGKLLTEAEGAAVLDLRHLRNAAAHGHNVAIDSEAAWEYIDSIAQLAAIMRERADGAGEPLPPL